MEEIKDPAYFKELAHRLMFDLSDAEAADIAAEFETLNKQLRLLESIDTTGVEPMVYPFETRWPTRRKSENATLWFRRW